MRTFSNVRFASHVGISQSMMKTLAFNCLFPVAACVNVELTYTLGAQKMSGPPYDGSEWYWFNASAMAQQLTGAWRMPRWSLTTMNFFR